MVYTWYLHGAGSQADREVLLSEFGIEPRFIENISCHVDEALTGAIVTIQWQMPEQVQFKWPSAREALNHDVISYGESVDSHEIVDLYLISYQLSMLARYYPDLWIASIESHCKAAKLIERVVDVIVQKLPILALSMLSGGITISTHREPWKS